jgi:cyclophilin family peptidyl-prolyl cis-trans isomerase
LGLDQVLGFFLNKSICYIFLSVFLLSCFQKQDKELAQEIRNLEFQRSADSSVFEKYSENQIVEIRILTADAIAKIGNPVHLPVLQRLLLDKEPRVIKKSIFALGQIGNQDSLLLTFLTNDNLIHYQKNIIQALGKSKSNVILNYLLNNIESFPDSLKPSVLEAITFIAPKDYKNQKIRNYLLNINSDISGTAAYFYSRHPLRSAVAYLIRANIQPSTLWDKYRLKALQASLKNYNIQYLDSTLHDSLKYRLLNDLTIEAGSWQHQLYELSILKHYQDSLSYTKISKYLTNKNPHLRLTAINAIAQFDTIDAKPVLLHVYQDADWSDKGHIILALSKGNPQMIYSLIQQNLDKGHTYFKQLLLKSLARIKNRMSLRQLRQFLLVPDIRLNLTAYDELSRLGYIGYKQTKEFLLSGDMALTTIAAQWIVSHPEFARFDDLSTAYSKFSEPQDVETLLALLQAMSFVASEESYQFFENIYNNTTSYMIAKQALESLRNSNINTPQGRPGLKIDLFVPEDNMFQKESTFVTIETSKGTILIELFPEIAQATVLNFLYLAKKGYYNNILFHRVVPDFVVQGGDPRGDGWGGPGYVIPCEYSDLSFERGTIGMATSGKDTGGSQFFLCHSEQPHLDRRYTIFGKVRDGMENVDKIDIEDKIIQIVIQN